MSISDNALCVKAQAMYGNRILQQQYEELCQKQSVNEVIAYLEEHPRFQEIFATVNSESLHRQQIDNLLEKNYFMQYQKLIRYAPKAQQPFFMHEIMNLEVKILIDKIMYLSEQKKDVFTINLPVEITKKMSFDIYGLLPIDSFERLQQHLQNTKYQEILSNLDVRGNMDVHSLEQQLMEMYYDKYIRIIKQCFTGSLQTQLLDAVFTSIELQNITRIYRLKKYYNVAEEELEHSLFLKYKRKSNHVIEQLIKAKDMTMFMQVLANSRYHIQVKEDELIYIEHDVNEVLGKFAKHHLRFSNEASLVFLAYCTLKKIEVNNVKQIIEGIRYHKEASSIAEMLIYV